MLKLLKQSLLHSTNLHLNLYSTFLLGKVDLDYQIWLGLHIYMDSECLLIKYEIKEHFHNNNKVWGEDDEWEAERGAEMADYLVYCCIFSLNFASAISQINNSKLIQIS